jgi:hypothetical protein
MQKYQKIKTCTKMALEADLPCGRAKTRCAQTVGPADRKRGLLPPCGAAIFVTVGDTKPRNGEKTRPQFLRSLFSFLLALLEIAGPQDGKSSVYVKKFVLFEQSEFTNFSKLTISQGYWKIRPSLFGPFVAMTKGQTVDSLYRRYLCREAAMRSFGFFS